MEWLLIGGAIVALVVGLLLALILFFEPMSDLHIESAEGAFVLRPELEPRPEDIAPTRRPQMPDPASPEGAEIIHIAGPQIEFDGVIRQRCSWCGALIEQCDRENMAVAIDPTASEEVQREEAARALETRWVGLVAIDGHIRWAVGEPEDGRAPDRSCMKLLPREDETRA